MCFLKSSLIFLFSIRIHRGQRRKRVNITCHELRDGLYYSLINGGWGYSFLRSEGLGTRWRGCLARLGTRLNTTRTTSKHQKGRASLLALERKSLQPRFPPIVRTCRSVHTMHTNDSILHTKVMWHVTSCPTSSVQRLNSYLHTLRPFQSLHNNIILSITVSKELNKNGHSSTF